MKLHGRRAPISGSQSGRPRSIRGDRGVGGVLQFRVCTHDIARIVLYKYLRFRCPPAPESFAADLVDLFIVIRYDRVYFYFIFFNYLY